MIWRAPTIWTEAYSEQAHANAYALLMADIECEPEAVEDVDDDDTVDCE